MSYEDTARGFKALCDVNRLQILDMLRDGEKCACVLLEKLAIGQSTLSHHMKILLDSGIVSGRKDGKWMHYSIDEAGSKKALELLETITTRVEDYSVSACN